MSYISGFVIPVPSANKGAYREMAEKAAPIFREYGATRIVETWGDDIRDGKVTDFKTAVQATDGEAIVFSWIEWPDKATALAAKKKMQADERMKPAGDMPFDGKRMIYGGFAPLFDTQG